MSPANLIFYSQSSVGTDWECNRRRYLSSEYAGQGLGIDETSMPLFLGEVLHAGLAAIAHGVDIDEICSTGEQQIKATLLSGEYVSPDEESYAAEQCALVEGILRGFVRVVWPRLMAEYEIVAIEQELVFRHNEKGEADLNGQFVFMSKPDLIVRSKLDETLWYIEYKSTSSNKEAWVNSWQTAIQLHSGIRAVEQQREEKVAGVIVQGLYKGYVASGKSTSPFCYAYFKAGDPPFTKDRWSYTYVAGYKKYPIWERPGGVKEWIANMPDAILAEQFPQVPPIFINDSQIDAFFRQRATREAYIKEAADSIADETLPDEQRQPLMDHAFPQNFSKCNPSFGYGCSFSRICHGPAVDPLSMGYQLRDISHRDKFKELVK